MSKWTNQPDNADAWKPQTYISYDSYHAWEIRSYNTIYLDRPLEITANNY